MIVFAVFFYMKKKPEFALFMGAGTVFLAVAVIRPVLLRYPYILWMGFGQVLSWVNTRLILCVMFYLILTPVGIVMRLFGRDPLSRRFDRDAGSYWTAPDKRISSKEGYERLF